MKQIQLQSMRIENFKGIKALTIDFQGRDALISGDNGLGKTSVYDAWLWLLFDKDSEGKSDFDIKPLKNGKVIPDLVTLVEASVTINGKAVRLSKKLWENRVRKRGHADRVFEGNKKSYCIDGRYPKESEWKRFISELAGNEEIFKALSIEWFFMDGEKGLKWDARRKILLEMTGELPADEIAKRHEKYAPIWPLLEDDSIEDAMAKIKYQIKELQRLQRELPARIDELNRTTQTFDDDDAAIVAKREAERLEAALAEVDRQLADAAKISQRIGELHQRVTLLKQEKQDKYRAAKNEALKEWHDGARRYQQAISNTERTASALIHKRQRVKAMEDELECMNRDIADLRVQITAIFEENYQPGENDCVCPVCRQAMPEDMRAAAKQRWEDDKAKRTATITAKGIALKEAIARHESDLAAEKTTLERCEREASAALLESAELEIYNGPEPEVEVEVDTRGQDNGIAVATAELERLQQGDNSSLLDAKHKIMRELDAVRTSIASFEASEKARVRIAELEDEERSVGERIAALQGQIFLLEALTRERFGLVESQINALFPTLEWRLFETQINGGVKDTCVCLVDGVPYASANEAAKVNARLEIIQVLGTHYGLQTPVFVDRTEGVNRLIDIDAQTILLAVSRDKALRVEIHEESEVA